MTDNETTTESEAVEHPGNRAHTTPEEGHPAGDGPRSDREVGGPVAAEDAPDNTGEPGAHGDIQTKGFDAHE